MKTGIRSFLVVIMGVLLSLHSQAQPTWRLLLPKPAFTIQTNPHDANKLYVGSGNDELWKSDDGGISWYVCLQGETQTGETISTLIVSAADTNVVITGGFSADGLRRSVDGGRTSKRVLTSSEGRTWFISEAVVEDPYNPTIMYGARGSSENTVYRSTDAGATWSVRSIVDNSLTHQLCTMAIRRDSSNILFIGASKGTILRSDDSGLTWRRVLVGDSLSLSASSETPKMVFSRREPLHGYAVSAFGNPAEFGAAGGILKTMDGGASWHRVGYADTSLWGLDVRTTPQGTDEVFVGGSRLTRQLNIVKGDSIVCHSTDGGTTWQRYNDIPWAPDDGGKIFANVWVLRYNEAAHRLYLAAESGLYVMEEPTSVVGDLNRDGDLRARVEDDVIYVEDVSSTPASSTHDTGWTLYNMQGAAVAKGLVGTSNRLSLSLAPFSSGAYVLTWGTRTNFQIINFAIIH